MFSLNNLARKGLTHVMEKVHEHFLWNCLLVNATEHIWWYGNVGSGNGLLLSGNKPLPEPILTQIYVTILRN